MLEFFHPKPSKALRLRSSWAERLLNWKAGLFAASVVQCQRQLGTFSLPYGWMQHVKSCGTRPQYSQKAKTFGWHAQPLKTDFPDASRSCPLRDFWFDPQVRRYEQLPSWPQAESDFYARYAAISALEAPNPTKVPWLAPQLLSTEGSKAEHRCNRRGEVLVTQFHGSSTNFDASKFGCHWEEVG